MKLFYCVGLLIQILFVFRDLVFQAFILHHPPKEGDITLKMKPTFFLNRKPLHMPLIECLNSHHLKLYMPLSL